jgi:hypothetical protein
MHILLALAFVAVAVSPFVGRWRANLWLTKNLPAGWTVNSLPEIA